MQSHETMPLAEAQEFKQPPLLVAEMQKLEEAERKHYYDEYQRRIDALQKDLLQAQTKYQALSEQKKIQVKAKHQVFSEQKKLEQQKTLDYIKAYENILHLQCKLNALKIEQSKYLPSSTSHITTLTQDVATATGAVATPALNSCDDIVVATAGHASESLLNSLVGAAGGVVGILEIKEGWHLCAKARDQSRDPSHRKVDRRTGIGLLAVGITRFAISATLIGLVIGGVSLAITAAAPIALSVLAIVGAGLICHRQYKIYKDFKKKELNAKKDLLQELPEIETPGEKVKFLDIHENQRIQKLLEKARNQGLQTFNKSERDLYDLYKAYQSAREKREHRVSKAIFKGLRTALASVVSIGMGVNETIAILIGAFGGITMGAAEKAWRGISRAGRWIANRFSKNSPAPQSAALPNHSANPHRVALVRGGSTTAVARRGAANPQAHLAAAKKAEQVAIATKKPAKYYATPHGMNGVGVGPAIAHAVRRFK